MNPLALKDVDNEVLKDADDYLRKHKILELFEVSTWVFVTRLLTFLQDMTTTLAYKQPDNIEAFLVD